MTVWTMAGEINGGTVRTLSSLSNAKFSDHLRIYLALQR